MIQNKLNFFFKNQIWHLGGTILLFYIAAQLIDFTINPNNLFGLSAKDWFILSMGDLSVKILVALIMLIPFRLLLFRFQEV